MNYLIDILFFIAGVLITLIVTWYQDRTPELEVDFRLQTDGDPSRLNCIVRNTGRAEARDVRIAFHRYLLTDTKVLAAPEIGAEIIEAEIPPDASSEPATAAFQMAFAVVIPRIAADDNVEFQVVTIDPDNLRAAKQVLRLRREHASILSEFGNRILTTYPEFAEYWDSDMFFLVRRKEENFFSPRVLSYEKGRRSISLLTESELLVQARLQDFVTRFKEEFIEVFQGRPKFKAPVLKVKTPTGERTVAVFPPFLNTEASVLVRKPTPGGKSIGYPIIPESYD